MKDADRMTLGQYCWFVIMCLLIVWLLSKIGGLTDADDRVLPTEKEAQDVR